MTSSDTAETDTPDAFAPLRIDTTGTPIGDGETAPLFYVDGVEYTAPVEAPARLSIKALRIAAEVGRAEAIWFLVANALSPEAIEQLTEGEASRHVTREQVASLFAELGRRYLGSVEALAGK